MIKVRTGHEPIIPLESAKQLRPTRSRIFIFADVSSKTIGGRINDMTSAMDLFDESSDDEKSDEGGCWGEGVAAWEAGGL